MTALSQLSISELQAQLGEELLSSLEELLPIVDQEVNPNDLYKKSTLEKIFIAFGGAERLANGDFRRLVLNYFPPEALEKLATNLGLPKCDSFEQTADAIAGLGWTDRTVCKAILDAFELGDGFLPAGRSTTPASVSVQPPSSPYRILKDYQSEIYYLSLERIKIPRSRFIIQMPTGAGKTRTAVELISSYLNSHDGTAVWLAHSEELCEQALQSFLEVWTHLATKPIGVFRVFGNAKGIPALSCPANIIVSSFQRMYSLYKRGKTENLKSQTQVGLVIVDEAHKVIAPTYKEVTRSFFGEDTKCIGLTATPGRSVVDLDQNKELAAFFFSKVISFDSKGDDPIRYLRKKRILSNVKYDPLVTGLTFTLTDADRKHLEAFFDLPSGVLRKIGADVIRNSEIVKKIVSEASAGRRLLFFGCGVEHSKFICSVLCYFGVSAAHVDGGTQKDRRTEIIEGFRSGAIRVLCNYEVLSTGFDSPKTDVVFISRPTGSVVLYSQMIGRGLRGPEVGGTESCKIIDVRDNIIGFSDQSKVYSYFEDYWESK